jgi:hypothetical protein
LTAISIEGLKSLSDTDQGVEMPFFKHIALKHKLVGLVLILIALGQLVFFMNQYSGVILFGGILLGWIVWVSGYNSNPK